MKLQKGNLTEKNQEVGMEEILNRMLSELEIIKGNQETFKGVLNEITSTAHRNSELIRQNRELLDRNYKKPALNERLIRENREAIKANRKQIEQNGRLLKQALTRLQKIEAKLGKGGSKKPRKR